ncbi:DinB family protein [Maribacter aestuarii]|uniref:DinB family protein n=1 Tax=Maribacter aestuarii TaxID=1130723 RepID=UPI00248C5A55|nr:DinB family protein [Maribacter aestuarii]
MKNQLEFTLQNRKNLHYILNNTSKENLLKIPAGFRNNIWWNIAHVVVTQQLLIYKLSGIQMRIPNEFVDKFKKGTVPDGHATETEIKTIDELLIPTIQWTKEDYESGIFKDYHEYTTSAKVTLGNIDDAISFNLFHEGLHLGSILALRNML